MLSGLLTGRKGDEARLSESVINASRFEGWLLKSRPVISIVARLGGRAGVDGTKSTLGVRDRVGRDCSLAWLRREGNDIASALCSPVSDFADIFREVDNLPSENIPLGE